MEFTILKCYFYTKYSVYETSMRYFCFEIKLNWMCGNVNVVEVIPFPLHWF